MGFTVCAFCIQVRRQRTGCRIRTRLLRGQVLRFEYGALHEWYRPTPPKYVEERAQMKGIVTMDANTLVQTMQRAVPNFSPSDEYVQDGLTYFIINDLGSYICKSALASSWKEAKEGVDFLENLLAERDSETERLIGDCIWGMLDCPVYTEVQALFECHLRELSAKYPPK